VSTSVRQQLAGLLELADRMQDRAAAGDWDEVVYLRDRFQHSAEALFAGKISPNEAPALGEVIRRVSEINNAVIALCRNARAARGRDIENLNQGRHAISSYSANAG
jgi:hypothetical protein